MQSLEEGFRDAETNRIDGLKLSWADRWPFERGPGAAVGGGGTYGGGGADAV